MYFKFFKLHSWGKRSANNLLLDGLDGYSLCHHCIEIISGHGLQNLVHSLQQLGVAVTDGDTDVDLFIRNLEVILSVCGEVQDGQFGVCDHSALGSGHIGADEVNGLGVDSHQHCRSGVLRGLDVSRSIYSQIECGIHNIRVDELIALKQIFGVSYDDFFAPLENE